MKKEQEHTKIVILKTVSHAACHISLRSDRIVKIDFKEIDELNIEHAESIFNSIKTFNPGERFLILTNVSHFMQVSCQAMCYWADKERNETSIAEAIVINELSM